MSNLRKALVSNNQIKDSEGEKTKKKKSGYKPPIVADANALVLEHKLNSFFYTMRDEGNAEEKRVGLHASSIIQSDDVFCHRAQVLSLFYEQGQGHDLPVGLLKIFAAGDSIHEKWQNMFIKNGICVKNEARSFSEKYDLIFTPDAILNINNKLYVGEIKSMNTFSFKKATSHPSGEKQCLIYMHLLGIEDGFVLAEDKNDQNIKVFPVKYDYKKVLPYIDRLNEVQEMKKEFLENKVMPARKCRSSDVKRAQSCNLRDCCFNIGNGRVKLAQKK